MPQVSVDEVAPGVHELLLPRPNLTPPWVPQTDESVSCHLRTGETNLLFGTGYGFSATDLSEAIEQVGGVDVVIAEHGDPDHYGGAPKLSANFENSTFAIPEKDAAVLQKVYTGFEPDTVLNNNDTRWGITCVSIPGHTPGNMSFVDEEQDALFVGDSFAHKESDVSAPGEWSGSLAPIHPGHQKMDHELACENLAILEEYSFESAFLTHGPDILQDAEAELQTLLDDLDVS